MQPGVTYTTVRSYSRTACNKTQEIQKVRITGLVLERRAGEEDKVIGTITRPMTQ